MKNFIVSGSTCVFFLSSTLLATSSTESLKECALKESASKPTAPQNCATTLLESISETTLEYMHHKAAVERNLPKEVLFIKDEERLVVRVINHKVLSKSLKNRLETLKKLLNKMSTSTPVSASSSETTHSETDEHKPASSKSTPNLHSMIHETLMGAADFPTCARSSGTKIPLFSEEQAERLKQRLQLLNNAEEDPVWNALFKMHHESESEKILISLETTNPLHPMDASTADSELGPEHQDNVSLSKFLVSHLTEKKSAQELMNYHSLNDDSPLKVVFMMTLCDSLLRENETQNAMEIVAEALKTQLTQTQVIKIKYYLSLIAPKIPKELESFLQIRGILGL